MSHFVTLAFCFISLLFLLGANAVTESELRSLLEFRKGIRDETSHQRISWSDTSSLSDPSTCPNGWPGISCDPETGSIIAINQLFGAVPQELLQSSIPLRELDLSPNGFTGSISEINSTTLTMLNLSFNGLSGDLPSKLKTCFVLDLSGNTFSGDVSQILQIFLISLHPSSHFFFSFFLSGFMFL